jgi:nucleotide-binding universal stress UspA family protein
VYSKIIVPLDASPIAEGILPYVRTLARSFQVPIELLHVITPDVVDSLSDPAHRRYAVDVEDDLRRHGLAYLRPVAASLPKTSRVECVVRIGDATEMITAEAKPGMLVAMATHGRSGVQRWLLGSVTEKVVHSVRSHLLLARGGHKAQFGETLLTSAVVPLDGSALAESILPSVAMLAKMMALRVILLRACSVPNAFYATKEYVPNMGEFIERVKADARAYLETKAVSLRAQGVTTELSTVLAEGDGAAEIIDFARETPNNLVAMSTHGRSGARRLLGSVTDRVVRHSWDPVLIVPPALALVEHSGRNYDGSENSLAAAGGSSRPAV